MKIELGVYWSFCMAVVCGVYSTDISLETVYESAILGEHFNMTCQVTGDTMHEGLAYFKRTNGHGTSTACSLHLNSSTPTSNNTNYSCTGADANIFILTIRQVSREDAGQWHCQVEDMTSPIVSLKVKYSPEIIFFGAGQDDSNITVKEHDNVTLQCNVSSEPASDIQICNIASDPVSKGDNNNNKNNNNNNNTLEVRLDDIGCRQRGPYTCSARNEIGTAPPKYASLLVKCKPRLHGSSAHLKVASGLGGPVTLIVTVLAYPKPTFSWKRFKLGAPLTKNTNITWDDPVATGTLNIANVDDEDYRTYNVTVTNSEGDSTFTISLIKPTHPDTPTHLQATRIDSRSITVSWDKAFNGGARQTFILQYRPDRGQWTKPVVDDNDDLHVDILGLAPSTMYEVRLRAKNTHGMSNYTFLNVTTHQEDEIQDYSHKQILIAGSGAAVAAAAIVITVIAVVVVVNRKKKHGKGPLCDERALSEHSEVVMEDNFLYDASDDLHVQAEGAAGHPNVHYDVAATSSQINDSAEDISGRTENQSESKKNKDDCVMVDNFLYVTSCDLGVQVEETAGHPIGHCDFATTNSEIDGAKDVSCNTGRDVENRSEAKKRSEDYVNVGCSYHAPEDVNVNASGRDT
ncbi:neural cell adhesion molecule 2-like [Haliotis cracherodii]|uniref:neural cell adhesion molecule 2-like n=1 Tax=Haliotis cracherodii TaxID=6455 RepID=UPI0039EB7E77